MDNGKRQLSTREYIDRTYSHYPADPSDRAPESMEEYIARASAPSAMMDLMSGSAVEGLSLTPEDLLRDTPVWLGEAPEISDIAEEDSCAVLVIGSGPSGTMAALRLADLGADALCLEAQSWANFDAYACDMASYNSRFFLDRGVPEYDLMEIYNEYMRRAGGHVHPRLVRDFVTRSGEMLDWMLQYIPEEYIENYAHPTQYKGNRRFTGSICGQKSFIGMLQWRDRESNCNVWPYVMRHLQKEAVRKGARYRYGTQGIRLLQREDGAVSGCIARDTSGAFIRIRADAVVLAAGDYGGNPDMRLDLCDTVRNLAWSHGFDRSDPASVTTFGRDGSGIRMALWAGGRMEAGPRAAQGGYIAPGPDDMRPRFPFGGVWPTFGPDGRRFFNETLIHFGANDAVNILPMGSRMAVVTDADWDEYCEHQGYGHEVMDRSNDYMLETVRRDMAAYRTGPAGFPVHNFAHYGNELETVYAAETIEELGAVLGYTGEELQRFTEEVDRWNAMCDVGYDSDWGCDRGFLFPIRKPPFFGRVTYTGGTPSAGLCVNNGVCTDCNYNVVDGSKRPIPGLYAIGNTCGQRFGIQYSTPTAGNCCGHAMTNGYVAPEHVMAYLAGQR